MVRIESPLEGNIRKELIRDERLAHKSKNSLSSLQFDTGRELKVKGEFDIWGFELDETSLLHMVLCDSIMNVYLYNEEANKAFAFKKHLKINYRSIFTDANLTSKNASVSVTLTSHTFTSDELVDTLDVNTKEIGQLSVPAGNSYVHVVISQAESKTAIDSFLVIFQLLMQYYESRRALINSGYYKTYLPESEWIPRLLEQKRIKATPTKNTILEVTKKKTVNPRISSKLQRLQEEDSRSICRRLF